MAEVYQDRLFEVDKRCTRCGETKPLEAFYLTGRYPGERKSGCKACEKLRAKDWARSNPSKRKMIRDRYIAKVAGNQGATNRAVSTKCCSGCGELKEQTEFYSHCGTPDRLNPRCKLCFNKTVLAYKRKNSTRRSLQRREAYKADPEPVLVSNRRRRARKKDAGGNVSLVQWRRKLKAYNGLCHWCEQPINGTTHQDHVIPLSRGGVHDIENVVPACASCNLSKGSLLPEEWMDRQAIESRVRASD